MSFHALPAWQELQKHKLAIESRHLRELFASDPQRVPHFSRQWGKLFYDYSKQRIDPTALSLLIQLARECNLESKRDAMFNGDVINTSEKRRVLHTALRAPEGPFPAQCDVMPDVLATKERLKAFAQGIRSGALTGSTGLTFTDVINVGIGGSDLGPKMMAYALRQCDTTGPRTHFISHLDAAPVADLISKLDARRTLVIIASKTFTTLETMTNANTVRQWLVRELGEDQIGPHLAAVSCNTALAGAFGIAAERVFPIWDWVGGRFSLWSAVGLALMIQIGPDNFERMLAAAHAMDEHFCSAPLEENLPVLMALIGFWNCNVMGASTLAVIPYNESLRYFPSFLQQLEMESNGKSVTIDGQPIDYCTCPVVWGELGNNGQHAFFQLLHQGGRFIPCDFIAVARADFDLPQHQQALLSNCFAQSSALAFGKTADEVRASMQKEGKSQTEIDALVTQRTFAGNQPSSTLMLEDFSPESLGALVALYEHKVFVQGILWGINSFDQWGVELGKAVAKTIQPALNGETSPETLDPSTQALIRFTQRFI